MPAWASPLIAELKAGKTITFQPRGRSMTGRVEDGQHCRVIPVIESTPLAVDDVVLCRVRGDDFFHLIKRIHPCGDLYLIGNNRGGENGVIKRKWIFGKCTEIRDELVESGLAANRGA